MNFVHQATQLILTEGINIFHDVDVLRTLETNFDKNKKLAVYVAAGKVGTGKSSHQDVIVKRLLGRLDDTTTPFDVRNTSNTLTQGVWVYPYPLFSPSHPDVQILVVDLEGMFGLKRGETEDTKMNLMKLYLFGMLISSVFTLHTMNKIDSETISVLSKAFETCRKLKNMLNVEPPEMFLLLKDGNGDPNSEDMCELKSLVNEHLQGFDQEKDRMTVLGRGKIPKSFEDSYAKNCSELLNTPYLALIDQIIDKISHHPKIDPTSKNSPITITTFINLIKIVLQLLNDKKFESQLILAIDYVKLDKVAQIYNENLEKCVTLCTEKANTTSLNVSIDQFKKIVEEQVEISITQFSQEVFAYLRHSETIKSWIDKQTGIFRTTAKSMGVVELFCKRKIAAEENEKQRHLYESQLKEQLKATEKAKQCAHNLSLQMEKLVDEHNLDLKQREEKHNTILQELAQQTAQKIASLTEKHEAISAELKVKLSAYKEESTAKLARMEEELIKKRNELEEERVLMKKQQSEHEEAIACLKAEMNAQKGLETKEADQNAQLIKEKIEADNKRFEQEFQKRDAQHQQKMQMLESQLNEIRKAKEQSTNSGLLGFLAGALKSPITALAMGLVKKFI